MYGIKLKLSKFKYKIRGQHGSTFYGQHFDFSVVVQNVLNYRYFLDDC